MIDASAYWKVNSYGFPNPFSRDKNSLQAWNTYLSFFTLGSYSDLKRAWDGGSFDRKLSSNSVESWKATFEEFGLLYVLSGSDQIVITRSGRQFRAAAEAGDIQLFGWIGLTLLLRYPLRGPRKRRTGPQKDSNLLIYWFLFASMRELGNYIWWAELERIFCRVFTTEQATNTVQTVLGLRSGEISIHDLPLPAERNEAFYNYLNQVMVHASMNYLLMASVREEEFYPGTELHRRFHIREQWTEIIDLALGSHQQDLECVDRASFTAKMPSAPPDYDSEEEYFEYVGAPVEPPANVLSTTTRPLLLDFAGSSVLFLRAGVHFTRIGPNRVRGRIESLCTLARGQRVILSDDRETTHRVVDKHRRDSETVEIDLRPARPITSLGPLLPYFEEE